MVSVCLPSAVLLQHLPSYLGFSYLGHGFFRAAPVKHSLCSLRWMRGISSRPPLWLWSWSSFPRPSWALAAAAPWTWGLLLSAASPDLGRGVAPVSRSCADAVWHSPSPPWPWARGAPLSRASARSVAAEALLLFFFFFKHITVPQIRHFQNILAIVFKYC